MDTWEKRDAEREKAMASFLEENAGLFTYDPEQDLDVDVMCDEHRPPDGATCIRTGWVFASIQRQIEDTGDDAEYISVTSAPGQGNTMTVGILYNALKDQSHR